MHGKDVIARLIQVSERYGSTWIDCKKSACSLLVERERDLLRNVLLLEIKCSELTGTTHAAMSLLPGGSGLGKSFYYTSTGMNTC
jgi:hypothetical protein